MCECFVLNNMQMRGCNISENSMYDIITVECVICLIAVYMILLKRELYV